MFTKPALSPTLHIPSYHDQWPTNPPLFQIAAEVAAPLQNVNKVTLVSGPNGEVGAAKLTGEVLEIVRKLPKVIEEITGVDMSKVSWFTFIRFNFVSWIVENVASLCSGIVLSFSSPNTIDKKWRVLIFRFEVASGSLPTVGLLMLTSLLFRLWKYLQLK